MNFQVLLIYGGTQHTMFIYIIIILFKSKLKLLMKKLHIIQMVLKLISNLIMMFILMIKKILIHWLQVLVLKQQLIKKVKQLHIIMMF